MIPAPLSAKRMMDEEPMVFAAPSGHDLAMLSHQAWLGAAASALLSPPLSSAEDAKVEGMDDMLDQFLVNPDSDFFEPVSGPTTMSSDMIGEGAWTISPDVIADAYHQQMSSLLSSPEAHIEELRRQIVESQSKMSTSSLNDAIRQPTPDATPANSPSLCPSFTVMDFPTSKPLFGMVTAPPSPMASSLSGSASPPQPRTASVSPTPAPQQYYQMVRPAHPTLRVPPQQIVAQPPLCSSGVPLNISAAVGGRIHPLSSANMNGRLPVASVMYNPSPVTATIPSAAAPSRKRQRAVRTSTYNKWTAAEDALLRSAVSRHGTQGKWALIAATIPGRTPIQCSTRWTGALNPRIHKGKWSTEEDTILKQAFRDACDTLRVSDPTADISPSSSLIPWQRIAERIPGRTAVQCIARYQEALDPEIRKGKWSADEDMALRKGLKTHGKSWVKIAGMIRGRTQRQCRTRWLQIKERLEAEGFVVGLGGDDGDFVEEMDG
ncbi:hypothetical protein HDU67_010402 [Dinochytrium kinnereticum]|nr:hypothetical protein HDU67_010402 [Dinochytrium kinnereticum]